jgi:hypothetical protein
VNKKKQKNFDMLGHGRWRHRAHGQHNKSFLRRFFAKKRLLTHYGIN